MNKLTALGFAVLSGSAAAQTPATNPMPDGSRDMYVGLGLVSGARYQGAEHSERKALPVLQVQWSNGAFISGMSAGMHLSHNPQVEYGPLAELQARRAESGTSGGADGIQARYSVVSLLSTEPNENRLTGMTPVPTRLLGGGFLNYYLSPDWRLTGSLLYGAGKERNGARLDLGLQRLAMQVGAHHQLSFTAGLRFANTRYNDAYFGVSELDSLRSGNPVYRPGGGLSDGRLGVRWNWALAPSWMLSSQLQATRLASDARRSPLVERASGVSVSTALAYRF